MWGYSEYVPVAKKRAKAEKQIAKLRNKNPNISPVVIEGKKIAVSWWGIAWNKNLERYADYDNRIGRGSAYVKNGFVIDLQISEGNITSLVMGSDSAPYKIQIEIKTLSSEAISNLVERCNTKAGSLSELLEGSFPNELAEIFFSENGGLFPTPKEIKMKCSCYDFADMCKHVAATLYGVGARLDSDPMLFFTLRGINIDELIKKSADEKVKDMLKNAGNKSKRIISDDEVGRLFGV